MHRDRSWLTNTTYIQDASLLNISVGTNPASRQLMGERNLYGRTVEFTSFALHISSQFCLGIHIRKDIIDCSFS